MKIKLMIILLAISFLSGISADDKYMESPYELSWPREGFILGSGVLLLGTGVLLNNVIPQDRASEAVLDLNDVNNFDRWAAVPYNKGADLASDIVIAGLSILPAVLLIHKNVNDIFTLGIMYAEAMSLTHGLKDIIYAGVTRYRPYSYFDNPHKHFDTIYSANSFYSGHTASAFTSAAFLSSVFSTYNSHSPWRFVVGGGSFALASTVAVLRVSSGNHFPSDVIVGAASGSLIGFLIPFIHKVNSKNDLEVSLYTDEKSNLCISSTVHF